MTGLQLADDILTQIRERGGRFHEQSYLFMLAAIEYLQHQLPTRRHVSGAELAWACRDFAVSQFGLLAPHVLEYWGLHKTGDFGEVVFTLVDVGLLITQPGDRIEDFEEVYDFAEAFRTAHVWQNLPGS